MTPVMTTQIIDLSEEYEETRKLAEKIANRLRTFQLGMPKSVRLQDSPLLFTRQFNL